MTTSFRLWICFCNFVNAQRLHVLTNKLCPIIYLFLCFFYCLLGRPGRVGWCAGFGSFVWEDAGSNPSVPNSSVWDGGQWRDSVSLARVDPAINGYLEKSGEGKQEGCAKAQDGWPPTPHCTSWLKGQETEISNAGTDCKV